MHGSTEPFTIADLQRQFDERHVSVNCPAVPAARADKTPVPLPGGRAPLSLPADTWWEILSFLPIKPLAQAMGVCSWLHTAGGREDLWVPAADRAHVDWNLALDRQDPAVPSFGRAPATARPFDVSQYCPDRLLQEVVWHVAIGREFGDPRLHQDTEIALKVMGAEGAGSSFRIRFRTPMSEVMDAYCEKQGCSRASVRFHFYGRRVRRRQSAWDCQMWNNDIIRAMPEAFGD